MAAKKKTRRLVQAQTLTIEPVKRKRGRPKMTDAQKAEARAKRDAAKGVTPISGTARPHPQKKKVAAAPVRRRGRVAGVMTKDQTIEVLGQRNNMLTQELAVMRRMLAQVYAEAAQSLA